ncbi:hypothetical protein Lal_00022420 [Lupinus albus]|nr:hypothetical protein Lal_00022420 [Lupinus albus]
MVSHVLKINPTYPKQVREEEEELNCVIDYQNCVIDYQQSVIDYQQSVIDYQQSVIDYQQSVIDYQHSVIDYQQSVIDYQHSVIDYQQSVIDYQKCQALWLVGDGNLVNFWKDNWLGVALIDRLNIPASTHVELVAKVADFAENRVWTIPRLLAVIHPRVVEEIVHLNISRCQDRLIWQGTGDGSFSLKAATKFISHVVEVKSWCKHIWSRAIPPSKSFTMWRLFHHKMPTDENMQRKGCHLASMCSNCHSNPEDSYHLFLSCSFALKLWDWLSSIFNFHIDTSSIESLFLGCNGRWSPQVKGVLEAAIIHTINTVWFCRNVARFENKLIVVLQAKLRIKTPQILRIHYATLEDDGNNCDNNAFKQTNKSDQTFKQADRPGPGSYVLYRLDLFKPKSGLACPVSTPSFHVSIFVLFTGLCG